LHREGLVVDALAVPEPSEEELAAAEAGRLAALEATRPQNSFAMDAANYRASTETIVSPSGFGVIMHHARGVAMFKAISAAFVKRIQHAS
jgi:hypothetical protein